MRAIVPALLIACASPAFTRADKGFAGELGQIHSLALLQMDSRAVESTAAQREYLRDALRERFSALGIELRPVQTDDEQLSTLCAAVMDEALAHAVSPPAAQSVFPSQRDRLDYAIGPIDPLLERADALAVVRLHAGRLNAADTHLSLALFDRAGRLIWLGDIVALERDFQGVRQAIDLTRQLFANFMSEAREPDSILKSLSMWQEIGGLWKARSFELTLPAGWMRANLSSHQQEIFGTDFTLLTTRDGLGLQIIAASVAPVDPDAALEQRLRRELQASLHSEIGVLESAPASVAGLVGLRLVFAFKKASGLYMKGMSYAVITDEGLLHLDFVAPARYYFDRDLPVFEKVRDSLRLTAASRGPSTSTAATAPSPGS